MRNFELETYFSKWEFTARHHMTASDMESMDVQSLLAMAGAGEGIYASMRALLTKSDHIIVIVPNYQSAESVPLDICQVSGVTIRHENKMHLDIDDIKQAIRPNTKIISINFLHNPTGTVMPIDDLDTLVALCRQKGIYLFSDEVYRGVEIDTHDQMPQIADIYEKGISLNVLSKTYGLPGLRIVWPSSPSKIKNKYFLETKPLLWKT